MLLTPREQEKLTIHVVADLARRRRGRGPRLNDTEAVALIAEMAPRLARRHRSIERNRQDGPSSVGSQA